MIKTYLLEWGSSLYLDLKCLILQPALVYFASWTSAKHEFSNTKVMWICMSWNGTNVTSASVWYLVISCQEVFSSPLDMLPCRYVSSSHVPPNSHSPYIHQRCAPSHYAFNVFITPTPFHTHHFPVRITCQGGFDCGAVMVQHVRGEANSIAQLWKTIHIHFNMVLSNQRRKAWIFSDESVFAKTPTIGSGIVCIPARNLRENSQHVTTSHCPSCSPLSHTRHRGNECKH